MRALSFWQPHGGLILTLAKPFETRSYPTKVRGDILLHAAKNESHMEYIVIEDSYQRGLAPLIGKPLNFDPAHTPDKKDIPAIIKAVHQTLGCLIGVAELIGCYPCMELTEDQRRRSRGFGDFSSDRWAWEFANVRKLERPIPYRGAQGFFFANLDLTDNKLIEVKA